MQAYDDQLAADMQTTWQSWRESFLQEDLWITYAKDQMSYLIDSGAFFRDTQRWPDSENIPSTQEIETFINTHFQWLDKYLAEN